MYAAVTVISSVFATALIWAKIIKSEIIDGYG